MRAVDLIDEVDRPRILAIVAHPDDEAILIGGRLRAGDWVALATNGVPPNSDPLDSMGWRITRGLEIERAKEARPGLGWSFWGLRDGAVVRELRSAVRFILGALTLQPGPPIVVTHAYEGGHQDHDALALACWMARALRPQLFGGLLEAPAYRPDGRGGLAYQSFAHGDPPARPILSWGQARQKRALLDCYPSQAGILGGVLKTVEPLREMAPHDFTLLPPGPAPFYARASWGMDPREWTSCAREALRAMYSW